MGSIRNILNFIVAQLQSVTTKDVIIAMIVTLVICIIVYKIKEWMYLDRVDEAMKLINSVNLELFFDSINYDKSVVNCRLENKDYRSNTKSENHKSKQIILTITFDELIDYLKKTTSILNTFDYNYKYTIGVSYKDFENMVLELVNNYENILKRMDDGKQFDSKEIVRNSFGKMTTNSKDTLLRLFAYRNPKIVNNLFDIYVYKAMTDISSSNED